MKTIKLLPEFVMTKEEIASYEALPENMPETKLTEKQKELVSSLYHKYISKIDNLDWSPRLVEMEKREKWPSGARMKHHEAQRICLNFLLMEQGKSMTHKQAMKHFFVALTCRDAYKRLISKVYSYDQIYNA